jgi:hypothetical protein
MATAPNKWQRWTDVEDSVVDLFPAREAAELLGRTYQAVRSRRDQLGLGPHHGNRKAKKRLRREFFATGEGPREEVVPPPNRPKCRLCRRKARAKGLCLKCYARLRYRAKKRKGLAR